MDNRYDLFEQHEVEDIHEFKRKTQQNLPFIWVIHDEFALWTIDKEYKEFVESVVNKLAVAASMMSNRYSLTPEPTVLSNTISVGA